MRCRLISVWHLREWFESVWSRLLSISHAFVYYTQTEARDARSDFSICRLTKWGHTWATSPELLWESLHEHREWVGGGGGEGDRVHRAQRSGGPVITYWTSGTPGHSIRVVGQSPKWGRPPQYLALFIITALADVRRASATIYKR